MKKFSQIAVFVFALGAVAVAFGAPKPGSTTGQEARCTPPEKLKVMKGFKVELLYNVPKESQGSWVAMCVDDKGRLIVSDQNGPLYRLTVPLAGQPGAVQVEEIKLDIGHAQGLLYAFDSLYVVVNDKAHGGRGLYRVRDTDGDDKFDKVELLKKFEETGGEHGPHAVVLGPDKKSIYVICGNQTALPAHDVCRVPPFWGEDLLLPRIYGRGFMKGVLAPRGWIAKTDPQGKNWDILTTGFRNEYDAAFNRDGELFTYDADMEWDFNTPWYRPTRICHAVSGGEWGWRNGSGKWPTHYPDTLPPVVDVGPGSPTGVTFGYGAKFPAKYQEAFFACDWSYGKLYAVHLTPAGSSYSAKLEEFITGQPLPLTDIVVRPQDQAMYFTVGGRKVQSGLYRVTYTGGESTAPAPANPAGAEARALRHKLEAFNGVKDPAAITTAWPYLNHADRFIRSAARTAIEHQPAAQWAEKALAERDTRASLAALLALARVGDKSLQPRLIAVLDRIEWASLETAQRLELLRIYGLVFIRMGEPDDAMRTKAITRLDPLFPAKNPFADAMLCELLVYLQAPNAAAKSIALLQNAPTQEEQISYAVPLRLLRAGWTPALRETYFKWLYVKAPNYKGGANFSQFMDDVRKDALAGIDAAARTTLKPIIEAKPARKSPLEMIAEALAGRAQVKDWKVADLAGVAERSMKGRNFENGRKMFGAAACFACHRFGNEGGAMGPDLTSVGGRFGVRDILESIIEPSKEVSDQYAPVVITLTDGRTVTGRIVNLGGDSYRVNTNMFDPDELESVDAKKVKSIEPSKVSMMPEGLVNMLKQDEILDLLAYLVSGGDPKHAAFQ
jgi:putative heme-binding domain-containing protein